MALVSEARQPHTRCGNLYPAVAFARRISAHPRLAIVLSGLLSFVVAAGLSFIRPPLPRVHDEFSYLLAADTFAHGRLSNEPHPDWVHFETFHVLQTPRYASKYPPVPGLFLALGQRLTGRPIVGAWLAVALGSAAVCWMLQGWTRPRWALLGGVLTALHHGIHGGIDGWGYFYSWSQSFWGGGPAVLGGALVLGAIPRLQRHPSRSVALTLGCGLALLAGTRPLEGVLVSLPAAFVVVVESYRSRRWAYGVLPPLAFVLVAAGAALAFYNRAVTGSPFRLPYALYEATYNPVPILTVGQNLGASRSYHHDELRRFFNDWCAEQWSRQRTWDGWWVYHRERLAWAASFFVGPLVLPLLMLPAVLRKRSNRIALGIVLSVVLVHLLTVGLQPHYAAPAFGALMLLVVEGLRRLALVRVGGVRLGRGLVASTLLLVVLKLGVVAHARAVTEPGWEVERDGVATSLAATGERHLVVVRYALEHDLLEEWVANAADIEAAPVVWAREMRPESMRRLLADFRDRRVWLLEADVLPRRLKPYPSDGNPREFH